MGIFKKLSRKFIDYKVDRIIKKEGSKLSPAQKEQFVKKARVASNLVSSNFEDNVGSGAKVLASFVVGLAAGGPVAAFASGITTGAAEGAKNNKKFVDRAIAAGLPVYYNGKQVNTPIPSTTLPNSPNLNKEAGVDAAIFNAKTIAAGVLAFGVLAAIIASQKNDKPKRSKKTPKKNEKH